MRWLAAGLFILPASCQKIPGENDLIAAGCAAPEPVSGDEISYSELIDKNNVVTYALRGVALGVDGRVSLAQDVYVSDRRIASGALRCRAKDGGAISSFRLAELDPNLVIPLTFSASDGRYTSILDLHFRGTSRGVLTEARAAQCQPQTLARVIANLRAGGAGVRIYRDIDGVYVMVERIASEPYIYRAKMFFAPKYLSAIH